MGLTKCTCVHGHARNKDSCRLRVLGYLFICHQLSFAVIIYEIYVTFGCILFLGINLQISANLQEDFFKRKDLAKKKTIKWL